MINNSPGKTKEYSDGDKKDEKEYSKHNLET